MYAPGMRNGNGISSERGRSVAPALGTFRQRIPIGVERALYLAATDRTFRNVLSCDRREALRQWGLTLSPAEEAVLLSVPEAALEAMIEAVKPASGQRRRFLSTVAAATAAAVGTLEVTALSCGPTGSRPDPADGGNNADPELALPPDPPPPPEAPSGAEPPPRPASPEDAGAPADHFTPEAGGDRDPEGRGG